jgi:hypothetical protein
MKLHHLPLTAILFCISHYSIAQDSLSFNKTISDNYLETVAGKASKVEENLDRQSQKVLERFQKQQTGYPDRCQLDKLNTYSAGIGSGVHVGAGSNELFDGNGNAFTRNRKED